jgi:hypothetical protein
MGHKSVNPVFFFLKIGSLRSPDIGEIIEQRFVFTPVIGVFVYHECTMRQHAEMGDVLTGKL